MGRTPDFTALLRAQQGWKLWRDVSEADTTLDSEAGRSVPPATPDPGNLSSGVYRPQNAHNAALVRFFSACGDDEFAEFEVLAYPASDDGSKGRGHVVGKGRITFGTYNTGSITYNPIDGSSESATTWREPDTLTDPGGSSAWDPDSPLEILEYAGFNQDNRTGLLYLSLLPGVYYAVRITTLPSGNDRVIVGILPFTE